MALHYGRMHLALELALTFAPFALVLALLVARCYPGEAAILRRRLRSAVRRLRPAKARWPRPKAQAARVVTRTVVSLRGPPALV